MPLTPAAHRRTPVDVAIANAQRMVDALGLSADVTYLESASDFPTTRCILRDRDGSIVSKSAGKGRGRQALASALFEGVEHSLFSWQRQAEGGASLLCKVINAQDLSCDPLLIADRSIQRLATDFPDARLAVTRHRSLGQARETRLEFPMFILDPGYAHRPFPGDQISRYRPYLKYATSSGTASGSSSTEALIHALTELIERDALSLALLSWYELGTGPVRVVQHETMPSAIQRLQQLCEYEVGAPVHVIDVTGEGLGLPTYLAAPENREMPIAPVGSGTSPDPAYAAERALTELLQSLRIDRDDESMRAADLRAVERLAPYRSFAEIAAFDMQDLFSRCTIEETAMQSMHPLLFDISPEQCLKILLNTIGAAGMTAYSRRLTPRWAPVTVVQVVVPGIERFSTVRNGMAVLPTGRGWAYWRSRRSGGDDALDPQA